MPPVTLPTRPQPVAADTWLIPTLAADPSRRVHRRPQPRHPRRRADRSSTPAARSSATPGPRRCSRSSSPTTCGGSSSRTTTTTTSATSTSCSSSARTRRSSRNFPIVGRLAGDVELPLRAHAVGRRRATRSTPATARSPSCARRCSTRRRRAALLRLDDRPAVGGRLVRFAVPRRGLRSRRHSRRPLRRELRRCSTRGTRRGSSGSTPTGSPRTSQRRAALDRSTSSSARTARSSAATRSTTRSAVRSTLAGQRRCRRRPGQDAARRDARDVRRRSGAGLTKESVDGNASEARPLSRRPPTARPSGVGGRQRSDPDRRVEPRDAATAEWLDGATEARPGRPVPRQQPGRPLEVAPRERGRHRRRAARVRVAHGADALYRDSTEWRITLEPVDGGTRIVQTFDVVHINPVLDRLFYLLVKVHRDRSAALGSDIERLGAVASAEVGDGSVRSAS